MKKWLPLKALVVFGTRPEAIKTAPVIKRMGKEPSAFQVATVVTAQHRELLDQVLELFELAPDYDLDVMESNQSLAAITEKILRGFGKILEKESPDIALVQGDTTTAFVAALAAFYRKIPIGHVEAGLRTGNKYSPYPEEMNRRLVDTLSDLFFAPTEESKENLLQENVNPENIYVTGNTAIDALFYILENNHTPDPTLARIIDESKRLILLTVHRRESWGKPLEEMCYAIKDLAQLHRDSQIIIPVHLNPNVRKTVFGLLSAEENIVLTEPLSYRPFIELMKNSYLILTDSGGIQEEAPSLGKPVLVLRESTERPEGVKAGTVKVVGTRRERIFAETHRLLTDRTEYERMARAANPYGDGRAAARICKILLNWHSERKQARKFS